jgi:hypothetical protein
MFIKFDLIFGFDMAMDRFDTTRNRASRMSQIETKNHKGKNNCYLEKELYARPLSGRSLRRTIGSLTSSLQAKSLL